VVLFSWRSQARPQPPQLVRYVPGINNSAPQSSRRSASSLSLLSVIQHNCLGSWDVFLSLFESFKESHTYPSVVFLQEPPVRQARLPSFNRFVPFFEPVRKPVVASNVHRSFLARFSVLPRFTDRVDGMSLNISQKPVFGSNFPSFRPVNTYSINWADRRVHSVPPESLFPDTGVLLLVVGDLNIHNPLADPVRTVSSQEVSSSTPYFKLAALGGFALLNYPGVYTRFSLLGTARLSVIDLAFANPLLLHFIKGPETSVPWTSSDHIPITILRGSLSSDPAPPTLRWDHTDWELLSPIIQDFIVPPPPLCPSRQVLDDWLTGTLKRLKGLLKEHTPSSRPSDHSKPGWSPHLTILHREYQKVAWLACKQGTMALRETASISERATSMPSRLRRTNTGPPSYSQPHSRTCGRQNGSQQAKLLPAFLPSPGLRPRSR